MKIMDILIIFRVRRQNGKDSPGLGGMGSQESLQAVPEQDGTAVPGNLEGSPEEDGTVSPGNRYGSLRRNGVLCRPSGLQRRNGEAERGCFSEGSSRELREPCSWWQSVIWECTSRT